MKQTGRNLLLHLIGHAAFIAAALFVCLGIPTLYFGQKNLLPGGQTDTISGASLVVPEQPSGAFLILLNKAHHPDTTEDWTAFFTEQPVDVIMEDIHCLITRGDATGKELAERYLARLAENQMRITQEDGTLIASRAECGLFDVILLSEEAAQTYDYSGF